MYYVTTTTHKTIQFNQNKESKKSWNDYSYNNNKKSNLKPTSPKTHNQFKTRSRSLIFISENHKVSPPTDRSQRTHVTCNPLDSFILIVFKLFLWNLID